MLSFCSQCLEEIGKVEDNWFPVSSELLVFKDISLWLV